MRARAYPDRPRACARFPPPQRVRIRYKQGSAGSGKGIVVRLVVRSLLALGVVTLLYVLGARLHWWGEHEGAGTPLDEALPAAELRARARAEQRAAAALTTAPPAKQILFGDLHVHTTFSTDAFLWSLPMAAGRRRASRSPTPATTRASARRSTSGRSTTTPRRARRGAGRRRARRSASATRWPAIASNPDVVAFLGWEWSQVGLTPEEHYGHKNVILRDLDDAQVPARAIGAAGLATDALRGAVRQHALVRAARRFPQPPALLQLHRVHGRGARGAGLRGRACPRSELPADCYESAATPRDLFRKLDQWGCDAIVIPHGNTWGFYSPPGIHLGQAARAAATRTRAGSS